MDAIRRAGIEYLPRDRIVALESAFANTGALAIAAPAPQTLDPALIAANAEPGPPVVHPPIQVVEDSPAGGLFQTEPDLAPPTPPSPGQSKSDALRILADEVAACTRCPELVRNRSRTVFSDGDPGAEICFVGEAPGFDEDQQGVPFVGAAGQLLTRIIEACKLKRSDVYICNVLKCRPPGNRSPEWDEMSNCREHLERQIAIVRPRILVSLGKYAAAFLLDCKPDEVRITRVRGEWRSYRGIPVKLTFHPSYLLRTPAAKREVWEDMKDVMRRIGRPVDE
jgi:DNA polymerase